MKKIATLTLVAAAALGLTACGGGDTGANNVTSFDNETVLNSEEAPLDNLGAADSDLSLNSTDNFSVDANTSVDNTNVDLNSTTANTVE